MAPTKSKLSTSGLRTPFILYYIQRVQCHLLIICFNMFWHEMVRRFAIDRGFEFQASKRFNDVQEQQ